MTSLRQQQVPLIGCALSDLTDLPRVGFRGADSADYLRGRGFELPTAPNRAVTQPDGSRCQLLYSLAPKADPSVYFETAPARCHAP